MKARRPPAAAVWLLEVFDVTEANPALIGDLREEYFQGRSTAWFWKQTLAALAFNVGKEVYSHKLLAVVAFIAGQAVVWAFATALNRITSSPSFSPILMWWFFHFGNAWMISIPQVLIAFTLSGWTVARFDRYYRMALVPMFAALQSILLVAQTFPMIRLHLVDSIDQPRFRPYLAVDVLLILLCPIAVLLGGYLVRGDRRRSTADVVAQGQSSCHRLVNEEG